MLNMISSTTIVLLLVVPAFLIGVTLLVDVIKHSLRKVDISRR
jgi:hypothetical protein